MEFTSMEFYYQTKISLHNWALLVSWQKTSRPFFSIICQSLEYSLGFRLSRKTMEYALWFQCLSVGLQHLLRAVQSYPGKADPVTVPANKVWWRRCWRMLPFALSPFPPLLLSLPLAPEHACLDCLSPASQPVGLMSHAFRSRLQTSW